MISNSKAIQAARDGTVSILVSFIQEGGDIETADDHGDTLLNEAARNGHLTAVQFLVERGAKLIVPNKDGRTALKWASGNEQHSIVRFLTEAIAAFNEQRSKPSQEWVLMDENIIAHIHTIPQQHRKLTDIFNLHTRERMVISENTQTKAEAITQPISFDTLDQSLLETVVQQAKILNVVIDEAAVLRGVKKLSGKNRLG